MAEVLKSMIVTGGGSGIGRAAALLLAEAGYAVTVADRDRHGGEAVVADIVQRGGRAHFFETDIADEQSVRAMVDFALRQFGGLHGAINSAGIPQRGQPVHELALDDWERGMAVNLRGMFLCVKYQGAALVKAGAGAICCVSSAAATKGLIHSAEYCASKAGVTGLVRAAAVDFAEHNVRINALLPGATETPLARQSQQQNPAIVGTVRVPLARMASPEEMAAGAVWMVSDAASYMTGACIAIDGGMSIA